MVAKKIFIIPYHYYRNRCIVMDPVLLYHRHITYIKKNNKTPNVIMNVHLFNIFFATTQIFKMYKTNYKVTLSFLYYALLFQRI